jgi:hypothetical protein
MGRLLMQDIVQQERACRHLYHVCCGSQHTGGDDCASCAEIVSILCLSACLDAFINVSHQVLQHQS